GCATSPRIVGAWLSTPTATSGMSPAFSTMALSSARRKRGLTWGRCICTAGNGSQRQAEIRRYVHAGQQLQVRKPDRGEHGTAIQPHRPDIQPTPGGAGGQPGPDPATGSPQRRTRGSDPRAQPQTGLAADAPAGTAGAAPGTWPPGRTVLW